MLTSAPLTSLLPGPRRPNHVLRVSLLPFIYLVPYFALFLQPFEQQSTWWCEKRWFIYALGGSTNLRCPKLRLPARILFGPRAPKVSFRDTRNCSKHSKINVSRLNFFFFNTNVRAGIYFRDVLIHSSHYRWKTEAKRSVWNSNPIQIQDLGMSIISSYNDRIISVTKELGLIGLIYL